MRKFLSFDKIKNLDQAYAPIKALDHASNLCRALSFSISSAFSVTCYRTGFYRFSSDFGKWIESNQEARRSLLIYSVDLRIQRQIAARLKGLLRINHKINRIFSTKKSAVLNRCPLSYQSHAMIIDNV